MSPPDQRNAGIQAEAPGEGTGGWAGKVASAGPIYGQQDVLGELKELREQREEEEAVCARVYRPWSTANGARTRAPVASQRHPTRVGQKLDEG
jgi:hypothetical protein